MVIGIDGRALSGMKTGVGRVLENLLFSLSSVDRRNQYILYFHKNLSRNLYSLPNVKERIIDLPFVNNYFTWLHLRLPSELLLHPVDIFHYTFYTMPFIVNCRSVLSIHDLTYELHPEWFSWKGKLSQRPFSRWAAAKSGKIITYSENSKRDIVDYYGIKKEKIHVIYHAADPKFRILEKSSKIDELKASFGIRDRYVLYVGNINIRRNIERLLQAFKGFSKDYQLVLIGRIEWPYLDLKQLILELELSGRVIHLGFVDDELLPLFYNGAEVFVYPSLYEGFGLPVLEAMACGTPVVTSSTSALGELYSEAALLVDPYHVQEIEDGFRVLLGEQRNLGQYRQKGLELVKKFSWERAARETLKVYQEASEG
jgi:glycosyltransferase involved in cell wall biosynthesis